MSLDIEDYESWKAENPDQEHCIIYYFQDRIRQLANQENIQRRYETRQEKEHTISLAVTPR